MRILQGIFARAQANIPCAFSPEKYSPYKAAPEYLVWLICLAFAVLPAGLPGLFPFPFHCFVDIFSSVSFASRRFGTRLREIGLKLRANGYHLREPVNSHLRSLFRWEQTQIIL